MSRKHVSQGRPVYLYPDDFPRRLERLKRESGLSWADLAAWTRPFSICGDGETASVPAAGTFSRC